MAIVRMQKVAILLHKEVSESMIARLQEEGVLQVTREGIANSIDHTESEFRIAEVDFAIQTLSAIASKDILKKAAKPVVAGEILAAASQIDMKKIIQRLHELGEAEAALDRDVLNVEARAVALEPWTPFQEALPPVDRTATCRRFFGTLPSASLPLFAEKIASSLPRATVDTISIRSDIALMSVWMWGTDCRVFEEMATRFGWTTTEPPSVNGVPAFLFQEVERQKRAIIESKELLTQERQQLSTHLPELVRARTFITWLQERQSVRESMHETDTISLLTGWMPLDRLSDVEKSLSSLTKAVAIIPIAPAEGEAAPVLLENAKIIAPFESVTTLYGLPLASEFDPTKSLSPFFALFFALCLTDAGYGLVLAILFGTYLFVTKKNIEQARLPWLLFFSGIVTIIVSIPFGGWFGLTPDQVPTSLTRMTPEGKMFVGQLWNLSTESGISFLQNLSIILGLTHIFFGIFLAGMHKWKHGAKMEAFWTSFMTHIFFGIVILHALYANTITTIALAVGAALFVWGKGYGNPWHLRPVMGFLGVANFLIGLLSNGLSYLRLLALGLVTGAIALAVNQVAIEIGKLFPLWIGIPILVIVAVVGHTVSIALNTLGSFIHSGRLQFIEFFSQFFEGGGQPFTPFKRSSISS